MSGNVNIVHMSTGVHGGAAIAALRIHRGLLKFGVNSKFVCSPGVKSLEEGVITIPNCGKFVLHRLKDKFFGRVYKNEIKCNVNNYEIYSSFKTGISLTQLDHVKNADIIHLHWVANFLDYKSFFNSVTPEIVWTVHDLNPFLGGLHYTMDLKRVTFELQEIEKRLMLEKSKYINSKKINFVFLSKWLYQEALSLAPWLTEHNCHFIYNGIETQYFKHRDMLDARRELGLPLDKKIILFISESVENYRKGCDLLLKSLEYSQLENTEIVAIGKTSNPVKGVRYVGRISSPEILSKYYNSSNVFALPSRQDNLPNVMLESHCSGCPIVAFRTGGMAEVINHGNGALVEPYYVDDFSIALDSALNREWDRNKISKDAINVFQIGEAIENYMGLYKRILGC